MSLSISTSWNSFRHNTGRGIIEEIKSLGFDTVELNFSLLPHIVDEISDLVRQNSIKISSVHNFCPIPDSLSLAEALPDCYSMASLDEQIRSQSLKYTKQSIDTAQKLKARAVVLHTGRVEIPDDTKKLMSFYRNNLKGTPDYEHFRQKIIDERSRHIQPYLEQTIKSLRELAAYAQSRDVLLGVETRIYFREIPGLGEIGTILDIFPNKNILYWHDAGHAQVNENLGFSRHEDFLKRYSDRMLGVHLHDVLGVDDHLPAGKGTIDFGMLKKYLKPDTLKVVETHQPASAADIRESKLYLERIFDGRSG